MMRFFSHLLVVFIFGIFSFVFSSNAFAVKRLAVLEFRGVGVQKEILTLITDGVRLGVLDGLNEHKIDGQEVLVMTKENMMDMLNQMGKSAADCQGECKVELGRNIGADYVISGELFKVDELYILNVKMHETAQGKLMSGEETRGKDLETMLDASKTKIPGSRSASFAPEKRPTKRAKKAIKRRSRRP